MLHDLFNTELFIFRQMSDAGFSRCMLACQRYQLIRQFDQLPPQEVLSAWEQMIGQSKRQVTIPSMIGPESSLPPSIRDISERLLSRLTAVDYRDRLVDHETVLRMIDTAIKILRNQLADQRALERRRIRRQQRLLKLCARPNKPPLPISRNLHGDDENV